MNIKRYYNIAKTKLFPITRSLTGDGVKKTLNIIQKELPKLKIKKFKSGQSGSNNCHGNFISCRI